MVVSPETVFLDEMLRSGPTLRRGSKGPAVAALQTALNALGSDLTVDGDFGPKTEKAVRAFQESAGIKVDGIVGPQTKGALAQALGRVVPGGGGGGGGTGPQPTAPPASVTDWSAVTIGERARHVMELLVDQYGYPENGAAGLVGNLMAESGVIPNRIEGSQERTPMRAPNFAGKVVDFTPDEVMNRSAKAKRGPKKPGIGLAQWTSGTRRTGLFEYEFEGQQLGPEILTNMEAQVDYLVHELQTKSRGVNARLRAPGVTVDDAADEVVYQFEVPGAILDDSKPRRKLPRSDERVQRVFRARRGQAQAALRAYQARGGG